MRRLGVSLGSIALSSICLWAESADSKFVKEASEGGMAEVELGQLAQQKGQSQAVKDFGSRMVMDHGKANDELKSIAAQDSTPVSTSLSISDKTLKVKLEALSGSAFDKAYMSAMVKDHQDDIAAFEKEANTGLDPKIKSFASKTLPTLQKHLAMAQETAASVGAK